jgi:anti-sigma-K factor RskA
VSRAMKHDDPRLIDALAAEYVLGTLRGRARARFERWRAAEWHVDRRVQAWEERLAPLAFGVQPVQPSSNVWPSIEQRVWPGGTTTLPAPSRSRVLRAIAATLVLFTVFAGGVAVWRAVTTPDFQAFATIAQPNGEMAWKLDMDAQGGQIRMVAMPGAPREPERSFELWALPDSGAAPVSLGLLPAAGSVEHSLSDSQMDALKGASKVAVSLEPRGGSPTGAPTGPVLFVADRIKQV